MPPAAHRVMRPRRTAPRPLPPRAATRYRPAPSRPRSRCRRPSTARATRAAELAALRRRASPAPAPAPAAAPVLAAAPPVSATPPTAAPTGQVDRDGDGRTDHWITREGGAIVREAFDENFDGKPDRTITYDPA